MTIFDILNLRTEWEDIVRGYKFVGKDGTIDNLSNFLKHGNRSNRFRPNYDRAMEIAETILKSVENETSNLPSVRRKKV